MLRAGGLRMYRGREIGFRLWSVVVGALVGRRESVDQGVEEVHIDGLADDFGEAVVFGFH